MRKSNDMKILAPLTLCMVLMASCHFATAQCQEDERQVGVNGWLALGDEVGIEIGVHRWRRRAEVGEPIYRERDFRSARSRRCQEGPFAYPDCPVYGDYYHERDFEGELDGIELWGTHPACAEALFEQTVQSYSMDYGQPHEVEHDISCGEVERSVTWFDGPWILSIAFVYNDEEQNMEIIRERRDRCDW